jgi:hypothetical protein
MRAGPLIEIGPNRQDDSGGRSGRRLREIDGMAFYATILFALVVCGCGTLGLAFDTDRVDLVLLTTDPETQEALLARMQNVEPIPAPSRTLAIPTPPENTAQTTGEAVWYRGELTDARQGSSYSIRIGSAGQPSDDPSNTEAILQDAGEAWSPRYVLVLGTAEAAAHEAPPGAVGIVTLICDFDLDRFLRLRDPGVCYRADGGLMSAALSFGYEWESTARQGPNRDDCPSRSVVKMGSVSGAGVPGPELIETVNSMSEELHRGLIIEGEGIHAARAIEARRQRSGVRIGLMMVRGIRESHSQHAVATDDAAPSAKRDSRILRECAVRDTADFAIELIRNRWPVSPSR